MRAHAVPLKEYVQGNIYRGIVSGLNNAFIIGEGSYKELVEQDPNSKEILKPVIRGADIHRYEVEYQNEYFIYVPWGFPIEKYPAVFQHLSKYRAALEARPEVKASRYQWYEMSRYGREFVHLFNAPKIVYPVISQRPNFAMDENKYYGNDKMFFLASADWYLLGLLNSKRIQTWVSEKFSPLQNGYYEFRGIYMENLPIPLASDEIRAAVAGLAQETQANYAERRQFAAAWWAQNGLPKNRCPGQLWEYSFEAFHKAHKAVSRADFCSMQDQAHALTEGIVKKEEEIDRYAAGIYEVE